MTIITQQTVFSVGYVERLSQHFSFESQSCFVFGNDAHHNANKDAQQIAEHNLIDPVLHGGWGHDGPPKMFLNTVLKRSSGGS